ncbi:MAG: hypothetical protein HFJ95_04360 [Muribaculaceae bacterium]|nr:hypothetical protein [Muribaculaceae bacterium]
MKRTTYIMIGAFLAGLVFMLGCVSYIVLNNKSRKLDAVMRTLSGEQQEFQIERFDTVSFELGTSFTDGDVRLSGFKGIKVSLNDALTSPQVEMPSDWAELAKCRVDNGKLCVFIDTDVEPNDSIGYVEYISDSYCPINVVVPRGMLKAVEGPDGCTIYLEDMIADKILLNSGGRLVLTHCAIDTISGGGKRFSELKLDDSSVKVADISASTDFKLTDKNAGVELLQLRTLK